MKPSVRALARAAAGAVVLALLGEALLLLAARAAPAVTFDSGPNTGEWVSGFTPSEESGALTLRWSRAHGVVSFPLTAGPGPAELVLRAGRMVDHPTRMRLYVGGAPAASFRAEPGGMRRIRRFAFEHPGGPLRVDLLSDDPELGLAVDWIRIEGLRAHLALEAWPARLVAPGVFLVSLAAGIAAPAAAAAGAVAALAAALWAATDPFALAHAARHVAVPALLFGAVAALLLRRWPGGRWVALAALAGFLVKGAALFHPAYFYPDVRLNYRYVRALAAAPDERLEARSRSAQEQTGIAYPRIVAGKRYAFPYSPVFYLPFLSLQHPDAIVDAIKTVALVATAGETIAVFALARLLGLPALALPAALVSVFLPPLFSRLLYAMWSTLAGHLMDLLVVCAVAALARRPGSLERLALAFALIQGALLTYVSSLFNVSAFVGFASLLLPRMGRRLLPAWILAVSATLLWIFRDFVLVFFREILPAVLSGAGRAGAEAAPTALDTLARIPLFYSPVTPVLALVGAVLLVRRLDPAPLRVIAAYALAVALLLGLRAFAGGLFKDLKELEFAAPLVALLTAACLDALGRRGRAGAAAAALLAGWVVIFGVARGHEYLAGHTRMIGLE